MASPALTWFGFTVMLADTAAALRPPEPPAEVRRNRFPVIDAARAIALVLMASYHTLWDLGYLRLTAENYALTRAGHLAAEMIAGSFLILVGIGLVLMNGRGIRARATVMRLARIGGAALLVTLGTWIVFPDAYVFFGVLHCIAVSSVLGLPFLFIPVPATALTAALVLAAPHVVHGAFLNAPALFFLGLGAVTPRTNDYVPLFPWFGLVLAGIVLGRIGLPRLAASRLGAWTPRSPLARGATFAGRHSLVVYLIHQPLLLGILTAVVNVTGPNPHAGLRAFRADYVTICTRTGGEAPLCRVAARCTSAALLREDLFREDGRPFTVAEQVRAHDLSQQCYATLERAQAGAAAQIPRKAEPAEPESPGPHP